MSLRRYFLGGNFMKILIEQSVAKVNQSGRGKEKWTIIFPKKQDAEFLNSVMGWASSSDMMQELNLTFATKERAIAFANSNGWSYQEIASKKRNVIKKSYSDNFIDKSC